MVNAPRTTRCMPARRGVVLVDVIVASIILGASVAALMSLGSAALDAHRHGDDLRTAAALADEQLQLVLAHGPDSYSSSYPTAGACEAPFGEYAYELSFDPGSAGQPYHVVVTISWSDGVRARSISVETLMAPRLGDEPDPERQPDQPVSRLQL